MIAQQHRQPASCTAELCVHFRAIAGIFAATLRATGSYDAVEQTQDATPKARFYGRGIGEGPALFRMTKNRWLQSLQRNAT